MFLCFCVLFCLPLEFCFFIPTPFATSLLSVALSAGHIATSFYINFLIFFCSSDGLIARPLRTARRCICMLFALGCVSCGRVARFLGTPRCSSTVRETCVLWTMRVVHGFITLLSISTSVHTTLLSCCALCYSWRTLVFSPSVLVLVTVPCCHTK